MTDPHFWQPPGGQQAPPPPAPGYGPPPAGAWAPPPRPGLIPLRPLTLGTLLGASFQVLRRNPRPTFGFSLLLNVAVALVFGIVVAAFAAFSVGRISSASADDQGSIIAGTLLAGGLTLLIPLAGSIAVSGILQGVVALEVARGTLGEKLTTRGLLRLARGRMLALIGWSFLVTGTWTVLLGLAVTVIGLVIAFGGVAGVVIGVLLTIGAVLAFLVLGFWIGTKVSLVPSILLLERRTLGRAIARSWRLTAGSFWKTLGTQLLAQVIVWAATQVVTTPVSFIAGIVLGLTAPTGDDTTYLIGIVITYVVVGVVSLVLTSVTSVMLTATTALIYIDLRMRREGLDLELLRFVEARQVGDSSVMNPYLAVPGSKPTT